MEESILINSLMARTVGLLALPLLMAACASLDSPANPAGTAAAPAVAAAGSNVVPVVAPVLVPSVAPAVVAPPGTQPGASSAALPVVTSTAPSAALPTAPPPAAAPAVPSAPAVVAPVQPAAPNPADAAASSPTPLAATSAPAIATAPAAAASAAQTPDTTNAQPPASAARARQDPQTEAPRSDLWQRVRKGFRIPALDNDYVRKWEQYYLKNGDYTQRMLERGGRYLFHIIEVVEQRGMPSDLAFLPFIESAFNPQAMSSARAAGMWQFMPGTGKEYALRQNMFRDDRRDILASTRAALAYLQRLNTRFGDWQLALAAYNWGPGNVNRAIERNRAAGLPLTLSALQGLPLETREYVPKLQAVKNLFSRPHQYGLALPELQNHPYFLSLGIDRDMDVAVAARLAGVSVEEFHQLNPQHNKPVILAAGRAEIQLPYDNANRFARALSQHKGPLASWTAWVAPRTLKAAEAARLNGMTEDQLREVNRIPPRMLVKAGSTLLVPRHLATAPDVSEHLAQNASLSLSPEVLPVRRVSFKAGRRGDSIAAVAKRFRVSAAQVAKWNGLSAQARLKPGQTVVLMLPNKRGAKMARGARGSRALAHSSRAHGARLARGARDGGQTRAQGRGKGRSTQLAARGGRGGKLNRSARGGKASAKRTRVARR
jgi:membrane-bound lytic murein transglycosylase D